MTLLELLHLLKKHLMLVIVLPIACALAMGIVSFGFMPDVYTATTTMYVLSQSGDESNATLQSNLSASQMIANDVSSLIQSDRVKGDTAEQLGLENLNGFDISVSSDTSSRVITLSVEGEDPQLVADVANTMVETVSSVAQEVMNVQSVNSFEGEDGVEAPEHPSGPSRTMYVVVAFLAGLFVAVAIVVLLDMLNTRVRSAEDVEELLGIPVIGRIPAMKGSR